MISLYCLTSIITAAVLAAPQKPQIAVPPAPECSESNPGGNTTTTCVPITASQIRSMGNSTLFTRWRPVSHFMAPAGWMNDPNGAVYDPVRDEYHLSYQWHPHHYNWGNISWGSATSKDMITWVDNGSWRNDDAVTLSPPGNGSYNGLGIFSGTVQPVNLQGESDGTLLAFYTSVSKLPTGWTLPYQPSTETQSLAISKDGGATWEQYEHNPVITATTLTEPMNWNITGFRDPFFLPLPELDAILGVEEPHYYAVFGSGIKGVGPRIPLWTAPAKNLTQWSFLGALWEPTANSSLGPALSTGSYGFNFEVSGFFPLRDSKGNAHWFVNMGSEGGSTETHASAQWALWNGGDVTRRDNGSALFTPSFGGSGDWGVGYALTSFNDTKNNRRIQYAWLKEDFVGDGGAFSAPQQGYQGALSLPRELFVHEVPNVNITQALTDAKASSVGSDGVAYTLGVRPAPEVVAGLRQGSQYVSYGSNKTYTSTEILNREATSHMEIKATVSSFSGAFGIRLAASPDSVEYTTITFQPSSNTILVDRLHSSTIAEFNNGTITGYFQPYTVGSATESITFDIFIDGSIVEVYVNDRFALTARIYPSMACSTGFGVFVDQGATATFDSFEAWIGTQNAWPQRPADSSSVLVYDTPEQTNNYVWWPGN